MYRLGKYTNRKLIYTTSYTVDNKKDAQEICARLNITHEKNIEWKVISASIQKKFLPQGKFDSNIFEFCQRIKSLVN